MAIFDWEQSVLFKQNGKQATVLKSYKKWSEGENRIVSGKGVELDIDGCDEKIRFFDVSQTTKQKAELEADSTEARAADITSIGFMHKHRALLLTALWTELSLFQRAFESLQNGDGESLLCQVSVVYIVHRRYGSNWQDEKAVETAFTAIEHEQQHLLGTFFSKVFQTALNLIVQIERRFESLVSNSEDGEDYYMRVRFYDICNKEKVAVCRLKANAKIDMNLSINSYEIVETLPYRPGMEREAFLEYLQSVFDNGLTLEHLVLVRRKNQNGVTAVTTYKVDVIDWNTKPVYVDFEIETVREAKRYYLRLISSETLDTKSSDGIEPEVNPIDTADTHDAASVPATENPIKRKRKDERTDVLEKINKLKEDIQNKTC